MEFNQIQMPSQANAGILRKVERSIGDEQATPGERLSIPLVTEICDLAGKEAEAGNARLSGSIMNTLTNSLDGRIINK